MTRVWLLRAVNVGGARLPMAELRDVAEALGATNVSTYIASGNLLADPPGDADAFARALEAAIEQRFGFFREVIGRTPTQLRAALDAYPFERTRPKHSHVYFLSGTPTAASAAALTALGYETLAVIGDDLHILYGDGVAGTKLTTPVIHRTLGVVGTGRNIDTVATLAALAGETD